MKEYIIKGFEEDICDFNENADWMGLFNEFHCTMRKSRIDNNTLLLSFEIEESLLLGYPTEKEERLTKRLSDECEKFKVIIQ